MPNQEFAHREFLEIRIDIDEVSKLHDFLSIGKHFIKHWQLSPAKEEELEKFVTEFLENWETFSRKERE